MEKTEIASIVRVPERLETVKEMLSPKVLTFCAQNPRNGYPISDPCCHFHLASESCLTDKMLADIYGADKKRIGNVVEHMFAILPDDEYAVLHDAAIKQETPVITKVFILIRTKKEVNSLDPETLRDYLTGPIINLENGIEIAHFVRKSEWSKEEEEKFKIEDQECGFPGVIYHYVNILKDKDVDRILNL